MLAQMKLERRQDQPVTSPGAVLRPAGELGVLADRVARTRMPSRDLSFARQGEIPGVAEADETRIASDRAPLHGSVEDPDAKHVGGQVERIVEAAIAVVRVVVDQILEVLEGELRALSLLVEEPRERPQLRRGLTLADDHRRRSFCGVVAGKNSRESSDWNDPS